MTRFSKVLSVFVLFGSLIFMGFAGVSTVGGPNWEAETEAFEDFVFEKAQGPQTTWTVKTRRGGENVTTSPVLPEVVTAAYQRKIQNQQDELNQLEQQLPQVRATLEETRQLIQADLKALDAHQQRLVAELDEIEQQIEQRSEEAAELARQTQSTQQEAAKRRDDVFRLRALREEIRTDIFRARRQQEKQQDVLSRLNGRIARLEQRQAQLQQAGATLDYDPQTNE